MSYIAYITTVSDSYFDGLCSHLARNGYIISAGDSDGKMKYFASNTSFCLSLIMLDKKSNKFNSQEALTCIRDYLSDNKYSYFSLVVVKPIEGTFSAGRMFDLTKEEKEL